MLNMLLNALNVLFLKPLGKPSVKKYWKSILFHENTTSVIVQQNIQNTHTRWNADIEFHKIHLAYQAHESTQKMKCT